MQDAVCVSCMSVLKCTGTMRKIRKNAKWQAVQCALHAWLYKPYEENKKICQFTDYAWHACLHCCCEKSKKTCRISDYAWQALHARTGAVRKWEKLPNLLPCSACAGLLENKKMMFWKQGGRLWDDCLTPSQSPKKEKPYFLGL